MELLFKKKAAGVWLLLSIVLLFSISLSSAVPPKLTSLTRVVTNMNITAGNETTWLTNYSSFLVGYNYAVNSTGGGISWANVINGTMMSQATYNTNYSTNDPVWRSFANNYSNFSVGWYYATNSTGGGITWSNAINGTLALNSSLLPGYVAYNYSTNNTFVPFSNYSTIYGYALNSTGITWAIATNGTLALNSSLLLGYVAYNYSTNGTFVPFTNFSTIYGYALNSTGISWAIATNGTLALNSSLLPGYVAYNYSTNGTYLTQSSFNTNYSTNDADYRTTANTTSQIGYNYATNGSYISSTNATYGYSLNATGISWATAYNGTLFKTDAVNAVGNFNQTFNGSTLSIWSLMNRVGIGTTVPNSTLHVVGDINATGTIYTGGSLNLNTAYNYALNNSLWSLNYSDYLTIKTYAQNSSLWALNYSDFLVVKDYALNASKWSLNFTNFSVVYGYALNSTGITWATAINGTLALNSSLLAPYVAYNYSTNGTYLTQSLYNTNYSTNDADYRKTDNVTSQIGYNYATNGSYISSTNATYGYSLNATGITWANAINGTLALNSTLLAPYVAYNYSTNGTYLTQALYNTNYTANDAAYRDTANTTSQIGYNYATNGSYISATNATYGYSLNASGIAWSVAYNGTLFKTDAVNSVGNFNQTFNGSTLTIWSLLNRVGIGTTIPNSTLHVIGDANITGNVYSNGNQNLSNGYLYSTNGTYLTQVLYNTNYTANDAAYRDTANVTSQIGYNYATNGSYISATNATYGYSLNATGIAWSVAYNGTLAKTDAKNDFGSFNQTMNTSNFFLWSLLNRIGIATTVPMNTLNVVGDINGTKGVISQDKNLSTGYDYALNSSGIGWSTAYNGTLAKTDAANSFSANQTFTKNLSLDNDFIFSQVGGNGALNTAVLRLTSYGSTGNIFTIMNDPDTNVNTTFYHESYVALQKTPSCDADNEKLETGADGNITCGVAVDTDTFAANYSNFSAVYGYALNASSSGVSWTTAYNGTLAKTDALNSFGNFNNSFNGTTLFVWSLLNRIGIGLNSPQNTLNVLGDINATTTVISQGKNLTNGYNYATNGSYISSTNATYAYSLNNTFTGNVTAGNNYLTNGTGGAFIYHNGTGWVIQG